MGRCSAGAAEHNQEDEYPHQFPLSSKRSRRRVLTSPSIRTKQSEKKTVSLSLSLVLFPSYFSSLPLVTRMQLRRTLYEAPRTSVERFATK